MPDSRLINDPFLINKKQKKKELFKIKLTMIRSTISYLILIFRSYLVVFYLTLQTSLYFPLLSS